MNSRWGEAKRSSQDKACWVGGDFKVCAWVGNSGLMQLINSVNVENILLIGLQLRNVKLSDTKITLRNCFTFEVLLNDNIRNIESIIRTMNS